MIFPKSEIRNKPPKTGKVQMSKSLPSPKRLAYAEALAQAGFAQAGKCQMNAKMTQCQNNFFFIKFVI